MIVAATNMPSRQPLGRRRPHAMNYGTNARPTKQADYEIRRDSDRVDRAVEMMILFRLDAAFVGPNDPGHTQARRNTTKGQMERP